MKRALIVGANGFLGNNLTKHLLENGVEVCALIQKGSVLNIQHALLQSIEFDLSELSETLPLIKKQYDVLYHFAWIGVSSVYKNDLALQSKNLPYISDVLHFAQALHIKKVICPGTASEYGCSQEVITGDNTPSPSDAYSSIKLKVHEIGQQLSDELGIEFIWTLISTAYGSERKDNNLIHYTIDSLLNKLTPKFTKLEQQWDYIYIDDLVHAFYLLGVSGIGGKVYPIGYGKSQPLRDYVEIIQQLINPDAPLGIGELPYKNGKIDNQIIDISELVKDTGFQPHVDFYEGIRRTIAGYLPLRDNLKVK